jgi:hypothetical protein
MSVTWTCPRCGGDAQPPGLWSDSWTCRVHGDIVPLHPPVVGGTEAFHQLCSRSQAPLWLPWPLPAGWLVSGLQVAGDEHTGPVATVVACSGPNPLPTGMFRGDRAQPRSADLLLVAEPPGTGLGARLAGKDDIDPGTTVGDGSAQLKLTVSGHDTPLWLIPETDGAVFVGEADALWLWALVWPERAGVVLLEQFELRDAREAEYLKDAPHGALSPRLQ